MNSRKYILKYAMLQVFYWASLCAIMGYAVVYMLEKGYSNSEIGMTMAASNIISVIMQPLIAGILDKSKKVTLRKMIGLLAGCMFVAAICILLLKKVSVILTIFLIITMVAITVIQPFINSVAVKLQEQGIAVNFGLCRACGSVAYAVVSTIEGILIEKYSVVVVPIALMILLVFFFVCLAVMGNVENVTDDNGKKDAQKEEEAQSVWVLLRNNKRFGLLLIGISLIFYTHMITSNYLIQIIENVGGNSSHMGIASSIAAIVELPAMIFFVKLVRKVKCHTLIRIAGVVFGLKYVALYLANSVAMIYMAQVLQCASYALFIPASVHYVSKLFGKADTVKGQSLITTATTLGNVFASLIGGRILDLYGTEEMMLVAVIVALVGVVLLGIGVENREHAADTV